MSTATTRSTTRPASVPAPTFNYDAAIRDLNERFVRLVKQLGHKNTKGSPRYEIEVEFAYALHEIKTCPPYLQGKVFDNASGLVSGLVSQLKNNSEE